MIIRNDFTKENIDLIDLWRSGQQWGIIHPDNPYAYYSENHIKWEPGVGLRLLAEKVDPREVVDPNGETHHPECALGLVSSKFHFKYGKLEVEAILPSGKGLWPAIWTTAVDSWPPEIDILEGYSQKNPNYGNCLIPGMRLQTNVHYRKPEGGRSHIRGRNHWVWKNPSKTSIKYSMIWKEDEISIYYNDKMVRKVTDRVVLNDFNSSKGQIIVLNNAIQPNEWDSKSSSFIIRSLLLETENFIK